MLAWGNNFTILSPHFDKHLITVMTAGVVEFGSVWQQDWERFAQVMAAKVRGAWLLIKHSH
ncbi:MAG: hypothetical protein ABFS56_34145 [Pseudomonadota bacterium]